MPTTFKYVYNCEHPGSKVTIQTSEPKPGILCPLCSSPMKGNYDGPLGVPSRECFYCGGTLIAKAKSSVDTEGEKVLTWLECTRCGTRMYTAPIGQPKEIPDECKNRRL